MKTTTKHILLIIAASLLSIYTGAFSQNTPSIAPLINIKHANTTIDAALSEIATEKGSGQSPKLIKKLTTLLNKANACIEKSNDELESINQLIKSTTDAETTTKGQDQQYLLNKKQIYKEQLSNCRYITYRTKEILINYRQSMQKYNQGQLLQQSAPIWNIHEDNILSSLGKVNTKTLIQRSGIQLLSYTQWLQISILTFISIIVSVYVRNFCRKYLRKHGNSTSSQHAFIKTLSFYIFPSLLFATLASYLDIIFSSLFFTPTLEAACYATTVYILLIAASSLLFHMQPPAHTGIHTAQGIKKKIFKRQVMLLTWLLIGYLLSIIFSGQSIYPQSFEIMRTIYISILVGLIFILFVLAEKVPAIRAISLFNPAVFKSLVSLLLGLILLIEWMGYHHLAVYFISSFLLTIALFFAFIYLYRTIGWVASNLKAPNTTPGQHIRKFIGADHDQKIIEITLLEIICYIILACIFVVSLMHSWNISGNYIDDFITSLFQGVYIADLKIIPVRILIGLTCFSAISLTGRIIAVIIAKNTHFKGEKDTQVAISSIIIYLSISMALLIMLLMIGVNFTGLAIIAGALSVGIGLGLQTIVNNFVSGVILLLEKPIKPGDRIVVGDTEGFVQKIRIRSTQVKTLAKEDVIFPNSDLITNKVTNYMFRDQHWRVVCEVGVAYGSDVDKVKQSLLEVAASHADVEQSTPNSPSVLFRKFGDSSLHFELWCIIKDVNKKFVIASDLNFLIDQSFRDNGITIAFPQRDIHIK